MIYLAMVFGRKDHRPLVATFLFEASEGVEAFKRRAVQYDHSTISDPSRCAQFCECIQTMDPVVLEVENSSHCHLVEETIHDTLVSCFPIATKHKKHDFLTDETFSVMERSRNAFKAHKKHDRSLLKSSMFVVFGAWAGYKWRMRWSCIWGFNKKSMLEAWFLHVTST